MKTDDDIQQRPKRFRNVSGREMDRRVVFKAAAGLGALAAAGGFGAAALKPAAAQSGETRATRFVPADEAGDFSAAASGDWLTFNADYEFYSLGASWSGDIGTWPQIELQLSTDGNSWSDSYLLTAQTEDGGRPNRDGRVFTWLLFTTGASVVRYRTLDQDFVPADVADLSIIYIDASNGPTEADLTGFSAAEDETNVSPPIINRESWGANESYLNWAPEYDTVHHVIVHHTATSNNVSDWAGAVRSIYYYHAVEQGWGDIGYNYLVSPTGRIYEGRYGGQNVIGGHSYEYANGSSGISVLGDYTARDVPAAGLAALVSIVAWVARDLDPYGEEDFLEAPLLPIISSHRDVSSTSCPGDRLWADLPEIRDLVASTLDEGDLDSGLPGGIVIGDRVTVQTDDGSGVNVRAGADGTWRGAVPNGSVGWVTDGPQEGTTTNWYEVEFNSITGWVAAQFLIVTPPAPPASDATFYFGVNIIINSTSYVRSRATTSSSQVGTVNSNTPGFILAGPTSANGYEWYQVAFPDDVSRDGWVTRPVLNVAPVNTNPTAQFAVPSNVIATDTLNVRVRPGIAQTIQGTAATGTRMQLTQGPLGINGYVFYGAYGPFGGGWVVENYLRTDPNSPTPPAKFTVGDNIRLTTNTNRRRGPGLSSGVIDVLRTDTTGTVIGGSSRADGYTWWQIRTSTGAVGWVVEDFLAKTSPPASQFRIGDGFTLTTATNRRRAAGLSAGVIDVLPVNTTGTIIGGSSAADGYVWWQVRTAAGAVGWVVEAFMQKTAAPPSNKFVINDAVRVTETLNLRSSASTSGSVIAVMQPGTTGTVVGGPTSANGYIWWRLRTTSGALGWAVQDWLEKTTSTTPTNKFAVNDRIGVTEAVNLRTSASTSGSVIAVLPAGTTGVVVGGPSTGSGYTWYRIQTGAGTGWSVQDWWEETSAAGVSDGSIGTGDAVIVIDGSLNLRSSASISADVVAVLPDGEPLSVTGEPQSADGYSWYPVTSSTYGSGWVAGVYIQKV